MTPSRHCLVLQVTKIVHFATAVSDPPSTFSWGRSYGAVKDLRDAIDIVHEILELPVISAQLAATATGSNFLPLSVPVLDPSPVMDAAFDRTMPGGEQTPTARSSSTALDAAVSLVGHARATAEHLREVMRHLPNAIDRVDRVSGPGMLVYLRAPTPKPRQPLLVPGRSI